MHELYRAEEPPIAVAIDICRALLKQAPRRLAFAGRAGAGKNTIAEAISQGEWPVINHADTMKEEILEWLTDACLHGLEADTDQAFEHFATFMGISPGRIQDDLWDLIGPVYASFLRLYLVARQQKYQLTPFVMLPLGIDIELKVAFVDAHKQAFREALQLYGQMSKELAANPYYWVDKTIARSLDAPICLNADTRYTDELECLRTCAWSGIYLEIDEATQIARRPDMTEAQRMHVSEWGIQPQDCDVVIDANTSVASVLMGVADYLAVPVRKRVVAA